MPLDTGAVTHELLMSAGVDMSETQAGPMIEGSAHLGAALRAARQDQGRSLQDLSDATKIKRAYLDAIEEMRTEDLPSRPFTIGYVRAYANALGMNGEQAVARFKADAPGGAEPLRAPVGVRKHSDARLSLLCGGGAVVVSAVLLWNLAQHAMADDTPPPPTVVESPAAAPAQNAAASTVSVSAAQPAPQESTLPQPYQTPGLQVAGQPDQTQTADASPTAAAVGAADAGPQTFIPHGQIYGVAANASAVTLQAKRPVLLVMHGPDGSVRFAQQLKTGEAYRAPQIKGWTVDVSDANSLDVYVGGQIAKPLTQTVTPVSQIAPPAPAAAAG